MNGILLMGPTASGKSALAMKVAETFPVEIISVDSAQVYRGMDVGTAKPTLPERARVPHHLIDIVSPLERYSAAAFARDARRLVGEISGRGNMPLLVGGTMLYFKALIEGLSDLPEADASVRAAIDARAAEIGWHEMHKELRAVDPVTAARLDPADRQRIQRALEVFRITRRPLSELIAGGRAPDDLSFLKIALIPSERSALHQRIAERFDGILASGLVDELRALREDHPELHPDMPAMRAVGYRQAWKYLNGDIDYVTLRNQGIFATRQLAKRQLTWLRAMTADTYDCLATDVDARVIGAIAVSIGKSDRSVPGFHTMTMGPGAIDA